MKPILEDIIDLGITMISPAIGMINMLIQTNKDYERKEYDRASLKRKLHMILFTWNDMFPIPELLTQQKYEPIYTSESTQISKVKRHSYTKVFLLPSREYFTEQDVTFQYEVTLENGDFCLIPKLNNSETPNMNIIQGYTITGNYSRKVQKSCEKEIEKIYGIN